MLSKEDIQQRIETEYQAGGYGLGWRFLYGPWENLYKADVGFWGINPGGGIFEEPSMSVENGTAYTTEIWKGRKAGEQTLQKRVVKLFDRLGVPIENALLGNVIPFRSREEGNLKSKKCVQEFSQDLWKQILHYKCPPFVVVMGVSAEKLMQNILQATHLQNFECNCGSTRFSVYRHKQGAM